MHALRVFCSLPLFVSIICFTPPLVLAQTPDWQEVGHTAGVVVTTQPQASAEAVVALPSVYLLPGTPLYWVRQLIEELQLILAANNQQRTALLLQFSQRRLAEGYQAVKEGNVESAVQAIQQYQQEHQDLARTLQGVDVHSQAAQPVLDRLVKQLQLQQSLKTYVDQHRPAQFQQVSALLNTSATSALAYRYDPGLVVLGAHDQRGRPPVVSVTGSATPAATLRATSSAITRVSP